MFKIILVYFLFGLVVVRSQNINAGKILEEDIDVHDLIWVTQFAWDANNRDRSDSLIKDQERFLKEMKIPSMQLLPMPEDFYLNLEADYNKYVTELESHPYLSLFKQVVSQHLLKYYCTLESVTADQAPSYKDKMLFYLSEMKENEGKNTGLIYTCFLKLQYYLDYSGICQELGEYIPFCENLLVEYRRDNANILTEGIENMDEAHKLNYNSVSRKMSSDQEYIEKLTLMREVACASKKK